MGYVSTLPTLPMASPSTDLLRELFTTHFEAAAIDDQRGQMKTTSELFHILDEHAPARFHQGELFDLLREMKVPTRLVGDELRWSVRAR